MMELLKKRQERRWQRREELRQQVRQRLKEALHQLAPGEEILLFGSVTRPHAFHERSDVDIAFIDEPKKNSRYGLQAKLEELIHQHGRADTGGSQSRSRGRPPHPRPNGSAGSPTDGERP